MSQPPETIGAQLRRAREARRLSIEQAAYTTRIRQRYLQALEAEDFAVFPSATQARGFLSAYARYLGLDAAALLSLFDGETPPPAPAPQPAAAEAAADALIFAEIGQKLKSQRELLGFSLEDVEQQTRLRVHYLKALEAGDLDYLPSPVQAKGMLANYAAFLGLDGEALLLRFAEGLQARLALRRPARAKRRPVRQVTPPPLWRYLLSPDLILSAIIVLGLITFVAWGAVRITRLRAAQSPTPSALPIAEVLSTPPEAALTATQSLYSSPVPTQGGAAVAAATATPQATFPVSSAAVQVYVVVQQRAWMRVVVDGVIAFEGRVTPGSAYAYGGNERVEILTGNAAALQVYYQQNDLGLLGNLGQVVNLIFTVGGPQTPTATITPTGLPPLPTLTPPPTESVAPTATGRP